MRTTILLVESTRANGSSFAPHLKKRYELMLAHTGKQASEMLGNHKPDVLVLDTTAMRTSGDRLCASLRKLADETPIIHIKQQGEVKADSVADILLVMPFTYRKLYNRIERFTETDSRHLLKVGKFELNLQKHLLTTPKQQKKLTPKLSKLMEFLMRNEGQLVERRQLINEVWQTDYMGDTRTLDVHIRWIRQAIESNPSKPKYIRTMRGKGYIFRA